jgi:hypothetical protein
MDNLKRKKIKAAGGKVVTVAEFLHLTPEQEAILEIRLALHKSVKKLKQQNLAESTKSSQSRLYEMEDADRPISIDLLIKSLLTLGATSEDIATAIAELSTFLVRF